MIEFEKKIAVLVPSRGLPFAQCVKALNDELDVLLRVHNIYSKQFWTEGDLPLPDCRNELLKRVDEWPDKFDYILWCDDDMVPPSGSLLQMLDALKDTPPEIWGVVAQSYSSTLGAPPPDDFTPLPCMKCYQSPSKYPADWWLGLGGGVAFSLWKRHIFGFFKRPVFTLKRGEDWEFTRKVRDKNAWVRALRELVIGHCYVQEFRQKAPQSQISNYNGCHVIKRYEDALSGGKVAPKNDDYFLTESDKQKLQKIKEHTRLLEEQEGKQNAL